MVLKQGDAVMGAEIEGWLIVVDMQAAFSRQDSRWRVESYGAVQTAVTELLPSFRDRVLYTRFVPPALASGSWRPYYERWEEFSRDEAPLPDGSGESLWDLDLGDAEPRHMLDAPTFSKWLPDQFPSGLRDAENVYLCGVALECCVLGTALGAVDAGVSVHLLTDAVGAGSESMRRATLEILRARSPQLTLISNAELLGGANAT